MARPKVHERKEFDSLEESYLAVYPWSDATIEEWNELNDWTVIATMRNGRSYLYDDISRHLREVIPIRDGLDLTDEEWSMGFAQRLQNQIYRSRTTQGRLADAVGITDTMMSRYITGRAIPRAQIVYRMAQALDCTVDDIMPKDYILLSR